MKQVLPLLWIQSVRIWINTHIRPNVGPMDMDMDVVALKNQ